VAGGRPCNDRGNILSGMRGHTPSHPNGAPDTKSCSTRCIVQMYHRRVVSRWSSSSRGTACRAPTTLVSRVHDCNATGFDTSIAPLCANLRLTPLRAGSVRRRRAPLKAGHAHCCALGARASGSLPWEQDTRTAARWERAPEARSPTRRACTRRRIVPLNQLATAEAIRHRWFPPPAGYALPTCHAASGRAARAPRGAGFQPACRHHRHRRQVLDVTDGAQASRLRHARDRRPAMLPRVSGDDVSCWSKCDSADGQISQICAAHPSSPWLAKQPLPPARDREHS